mgnify:CR=1 FL=1
MTQRKGKSRFLPMPIHSLLLFVVWLLLNNTLAFGHIVLGAFLAITIPMLVTSLAPAQPSIKKPGLAFRYFMLVLWDILTANFEVARKVLSPMNKLNPGMVAVPLDIESELGITLFASTISLTPGTVSAEISEDKQWLYVHALDIEDEQALIDEMKQRYEIPLKEILGC